MRSPPSRAACKPWLRSAPTVKPLTHVRPSRLPRRLQLLLQWHEVQTLLRQVLCSTVKCDQRMTGAQQDESRQQASVFVEVSQTELRLQALVDRVQADSAGATVTFSGVTRDNFKGKRVLYLEYEAYNPMAEGKLQASVNSWDAGMQPDHTTQAPLRLGKQQEISEQAHRKWQLCSSAIAHRVGRVDIGHASVVIAVSSAHRREALEACLEACLLPMPSAS